MPGTSCWHLPAGTSCLPPGCKPFGLRWHAAPSPRHLCSQKLSTIATGFSKLRSLHPEVFGNATYGKRQLVPPAMRTALLDAASVLHWAAAELPYVRKPLLDQQSMQAAAELPDVRKPLLDQLGSVQWVPFTPGA